MLEAALALTISNLGLGRGIQTILYIYWNIAMAGKSMRQLVDGNLESIRRQRILNHFS